MQLSPPTLVIVSGAPGSGKTTLAHRLAADLRRGRRPGFTLAAPPEVAEPMVDRFVARLRAAGRKVETGRFGAEMELELVNDGPFTLVLEAGGEG